MKIRLGFVSNSSSSSFLVAFPREPKNSEDVRDMVFGEDKVLQGLYKNESYSAGIVSENIWEDINKQDLKNLDLDGMYNLTDDYDNYDLDDRSYNYRIIKPNHDWVAEERESRIIILKFIRDNKNSSIYSFNYSDDNGISMETAMEHSDLFHNLKHLISSNH